MKILMIEFIFIYIKLIIIVNKYISKKYNFFSFYGDKKIVFTLFFFNFKAYI